VAHEEVAADTVDVDRHMVEAAVVVTAVAAATDHHEAADTVADTGLEGLATARTSLRHRVRCPWNGNLELCALFKVIKVWSGDQVYDGRDFGQSLVCSWV